MTTSASAEPAPSFLADAKVIGLIGVAHAFSHYYVLLIPPLFPLLKDTFGVSYTQLGLIMTVFNVATLLTQAPFGILVDRVGARAILIGGLAVEAAAFALMGTTGGYVALLLLMAVAGAANGVYHPADYAILSASVSERRMGRGFSLHTFSGYVGFALAPIVVLPLSAAYGVRTALIVSGLAGLAAAAVLVLYAKTLKHEPKPATGADAPAGRGNLSLLMSPPILICLAFFALLSLSSGGITGFFVSTMHKLRGLDVAAAGSMLSAYLVASAAGIIVGGFVADRTRHHNVVAALCFLLSAAVVWAISATAMPVWLIHVSMITLGLLTGLIQPSRDMIVRSVTPAGSFGRVFGFVTTGFNVGGIIAPLVYGAILDHTTPDWVFLVTAGFMLVSMATVFTGGRRR